MTPEQKLDVDHAVAYHREFGGYDSHNVSGRSCSCAACRLVRTVEDNARMLQALRYICRPTMGLTGDVTDLRDFALHQAKDELVRLALATCIEVAQRALVDIGLDERGV